MSAVVKKLISAIEDSPLRLEDHQALLFEAETTAVRSWAVGLCPPDQGPRDGEVFVFYLSLVLQAPYVGAEAGCISPAGRLEVLFVVAEPLLPLRLHQPQIGLLWGVLHLHCTPGHFHFHRGPVNDALGQALATQWALASHPGLLWAAAVAPGPLWLHLSLVGDHLVVVASNDPPKAWHGRVGNLDLFSVEDLAQGVGGRKAGVHQVEELPPNVGSDAGTPWGVETASRE